MKCSIAIPHALVLLFNAVMPLQNAGVGGVHRGGHISMDVSADLIELGRTPMAGMLCPAQATGT